MEGETSTYLLISTKLHRPPLDRIHVHRPHLLERLDQRRSRPLTLVSAPAGYGKSVLIRSWLESFNIPSAWVSLDKNDNDLRTFATYFVAAVETLFSGNFAAGSRSHNQLNLLFSDNRVKFLYSFR